MKVTKYPQSCLLLEKNQTRVVIDPGGEFTKKYTAEELGKLDAVLYTHRHADHFDPQLVEGFLQNAVPLFANKETAALIEGESTIVNDGDEFRVGDFSFKARELPHNLDVNGAAGPQNTGYIVDGVFFHPGDGIEIENMSVETVAAPMAGAGISPKAVFEFLESIQAQRVIPIHNDIWTANIERMLAKTRTFNLPYEWIVLEHGESAEL